MDPDSSPEIIQHNPTSSHKSLNPEPNTALSSVILEPGVPTLNPKPCTPKQLNPKS